ncbi:F-box protein At5g03100-like [Cornus florida]|uniref:F-box protein At5g03100-like n=1 Tax=Cornus florida TaxID=4283 RepID=UPI0028982402|nr:F-box protein At5g03100-like [Cornus florida]
MHTIRVVEKRYIPYNQARVCFLFLMPPGTRRNPLFFRSNGHYNTNYNSYDDDEEEQDKSHHREYDTYDEDDDDEEEEEQPSFDFSGDEKPRGSDGDESTDCDEESLLLPRSLPQPPPPSLPPDKTSASPSKQQRGETPDRIGSLPDKLLLHILSFLPMKDVVKTGVLSKRWVYLWTSVENILFSFRDLPNDSNYFSNRISPYEKGLQKFISFVDKTLILCTSSTVRKFCLDFGYDRRFVPTVNVWVRFAMQKNVEELELTLYNRCPGNRYKLPQYVYTNSALAKLSLSKCKIISYKAVQWSSLRALTIKCTEVSNYAIGKILSGSPVLEFLELYRCWLFDDRLNINSASLKKLVIRGYRNPFLEEEKEESVISAPKVLSLEIMGYIMRKKFRLEKVSSLVEAKLNFEQDYSRLDDYQANRDMLTGLLTSLQHVKDLTLGSFCIQVLSTLEVKGLPSPLSECKR